MAKTSAERQAAYRVRHLQDEAAGGERLNMVVDLHAKRALERLAICYGVTQKVMLERLLAEAERATLEKALGLPNGPEEYYDGRLRLAVTA